AVPRVDLPGRRLPAGPRERPAHPPRREERAVDLLRHAIARRDRPRADDGDRLLDAIVEDRPSVDAIDPREIRTRRLRVIRADLLGRREAGLFQPRLRLLPLGE